MANGLDYAGATILSSPIVVEVILPFVVVFAVVFGILQKTEIFGKGKKQIDAIVSLVIALLLISFIQFVNLIVNLLVFLATASVIILVFMILYGMVFKEGEFQMSKGLKITFGILAAIAVITAVLLFSGYWDIIYSRYLVGEGSTILLNIVFIVIIIAAIAVVIGSAGKGDNKGKSSSS